MNKHLPILMLVSGLAACASYERAGPPAPVVTAGRQPAAQTPAKPVQTPPPEEKVEVYAYRPPASAPDAPVPSEAAPAEGAGNLSAGPVSEAATPAPSGAIPQGTGGGAPPSSEPPGEKVSTPTLTPAPEVVVAHVPPPPSTPTLSPAADSLIKKAEQERQAGDYVGAAATLERALGIQPQEPYIWNRLARVRMEQGLYAQAGTLALRSNALAGDQAVLKQDNWRMIAAARRAVGDTAGAAEAERKAQGG
jgi:hypothetical protein